MFFLALYFVSTDPGIGNVLSGVAYQINNISLVGTLDSESASGGSANLRIGL